jgi:hypothetical protein
MKCLGLDISTTTCGFAITENQQIFDLGFFDISKVSTYKEKARIIITGIEIKQFDVITVEEALSGFAFGRTSQQVLLKLAMNKAVICYILEEHFRKPIRHANATTMRKQLFGVSRIKGVPPKEFVKSQIEKRFDVSQWAKRNKLGNMDKRMGDAYDAVVAAFYTP